MKLLNYIQTVVCLKTTGKTHGIFRINLALVSLESSVFNDANIISRMIITEKHVSCTEESQEGYPEEKTCRKYVHLRETCGYSAILGDQTCEHCNSGNLGTTKTYMTRSKTRIYLLNLFLRC